MKVLFVDVDGPLIPATSLLMDIGASVVMNTTHNRDFEGLPDICDAMVATGFNVNFFHPRAKKTAYPAWNKRNDAVRQWLASHSYIEDYLCIDDVVCASPDHMICVDPYIGLTLRHANEIIARWGGDELVFLC